VSLDELHGHELEVKSDDSHSKGESHTDDLVHVVAVVISPGIDPDTFIAFEKLTLLSSYGFLQLILDFIALNFRHYFYFDF